MSVITNLNLKNKELSHVIGRDIEVEAVIETLLRIEKPNLIITSEAGVGKTALVNHLAHLINNNLVPEELQGYSISEVNLNDFLAGDGYRGVFEKKCQDLIDGAVQKGKAIIFMDEIHVAEKLGQMANGQTPGFGNMLKPHLTGGLLRVIGATTNEEYNKIEDKAFLRRFRRLPLGEPNKEVCKEIILNCISRFNTRKTKVVSFQGLIDKVYDLSLNFTGYNPDKIIDIVDILFAKCRINNIETLTPLKQDKFLDVIAQTKKLQGSNSAIQL